MRSRSWPRWVWAAVGVAALAGVIGGAVVLVGDGGGDSGDAGDDQTAAATATTTWSSVPEELTPQRAFARAAHLLREAGSFTYRGTVHAAGRSIMRPGPWLSSDVTVEGEVSLPDRTHEVAVDASGRAAETVSSGVTVWGRASADRSGLAAQPYEVASEVGHVEARPESGAALLPMWLAVSTDRRDDGTDTAGRRTLRASVPTPVIEGDEAGTAGRADMVMTVDESGAPVRVEVATTAGAPLRLAFELAGIGERVTIAVPGGDRTTSVTGPVTVEEVVAAGIAHPVELGEIPPGWSLYNMELTPNSPRVGCSRLQLDYEHADVRGLAQFIDLNVMSAQCAADQEPLPEPLAAGQFRGTVEADPAGAVGLVSDGQTAVDFFSDLPTADIVTLLESLVPFDPATPPEPTADVGVT